MNKYIILSLLIIFPFLAQSGNFKITHGPYLQHVSENEITIKWTTNKPCKSWVEYAPQKQGSFYKTVPQRAYSSHNGLIDIDTVHSIHIRGLEPGTKYLYRVLSQEIEDFRPYRPKLGEIISTDIYKKPLTFSTLDPAENEIRMLMINDIHGNNALLSKLLSIGNIKKQNLIVFCGDMCNYVGSQKDIFNGFLDCSINEFASQQPFIYARGNHEIRGAYARNFPQYLANETGKFYYSFIRGDIFFIVLDGGEDKPDSDIEYSGLVDFDNYMKEQAEWLREEVNSEKYRNSRYHIVISHIPFTQNGWAGEIRLRKMLNPILENAGIDLMLSGHYHSFSFWEKGKATNYPIIINSSKSVLNLVSNGQSLQVKIVDENGKTLMNQQIIKP